MEKIRTFGKTSAALLAMLAILLATLPAAAQTAPGGDDLTWPRTVKQGADVLTLYQPQIEKWTGAEIVCSAAVSIQSAPSAGQAGESAAPLYGVARLSARAEMDKAAHLVTLQDFQLAKITFATAPEKGGQYVEGFRKLLPAGARKVALDRLENSLALTEGVKKQLALEAKNDVPRILFTTIPTILVLVDGAPVLRPMPGLNVERVLNTRALIVKLNGLFFLTAWDGWYEAAAIEGPWLAVDAPPAILARVRQEAVATKQVDLMQPPEGAAQPETPPVVRVSVVPAELIQTAGPPLMVPVEGTFLLQVRNTGNALFVDLNSNLHYAQLSGRWYRTKSPYYGPWEAVPAGALPADFAKIPPAAENVASVVPPAPPAAVTQRRFPPPDLPPPPDSYAVTPPPPPPMEVVPPYPGEGYVWTGGYWGWAPTGWVWIGGHWGVGVDLGGIGLWFGPGHFRHGWGGHRR